MEFLGDVAYGFFRVFPVGNVVDAVLGAIGAVDDSAFCLPAETFIGTASLIGQQRAVFYGAMLLLQIQFMINSRHFPAPKGEDFYETHRSQLLTHYDYIIAGGGSAGCLLANRLSANRNTTVLLIEGGGVPNILSQVPAIIHLNQNNPDSGLDWLYFSVPQTIGFQRVHGDSGHFKRSHMGAGKGLGGSSHINAQMYSRARKADFDRWAELYGAEGWSGDEVWPYMKTYEKQLDPELHTENHGVDGEMQVSTAPWAHNKPLVKSFVEAAGEVTGTKPWVDYNDGVSNGFARLQSTTNEYGASSHSARSFLDPVRKQRPNLHIMLHSMVSRVLFDGTRAVGVEVEREGRSRLLRRPTRQFYADREVILSAGTARSPQILLLSGVGPKTELDKFNIPQVVEAPVGENLHDHIWVLGVNLVFPDGKGYCEASVRELRHFFEGKSSLLRAPNLVEAIGFYSTNNTAENRPDVEIFLVEASPNRQESHIYLNAVGVSERDFNRYFRQRGQGLRARGAILAPTLLHSPTRGRVRLQSTNINDHPIFDIQYLSSQQDLDVLVDSVRKSKKIAQEISKRLPYKSEYTTATVPGCEEFPDKDSREYIECHIKAYTASIWHMSGTCSLGSVVDSRLRVRGVSNLRVIDASIFPEHVSGHMVATVYAVAEKGAQMILEDQRRNLSG